MVSQKFSIDYRRVCAYLCIYNCLKERIVGWIKAHNLQENHDYVKDGDGIYHLTSAAAQKIYMAYYLEHMR